MQSTDADLAVHLDLINLDYITLGRLGYGMTPFGKTAQGRHFCDGRKVDLLSAELDTFFLLLFCNRLFYQGDLVLLINRLFTF